MRYGSICSGIEAASVAWHPLGWKPAFFAEIDKFPSAVLAHRYPHVPNLGDFTAIRPDQHEPIDLLVGGTPCQSFSIAGLRGGMADARGNLALEFLRLADRARPRWLVWENVPGVLSSNKGRDFGAILGGMVELGYGIAYRVLDAQYVRVDGFGRAVPQRRRRVFVVGYLGDWRRAAAVLFERASLLGDSAPCREAGERVAPTISTRPTGGGGLGSDFDGGLIPSHDASQPLLAKSNSSHRADAESYVAHALRADGFDASEDGTGRGTPLVAVAGAICRDSFSGGAGGRPEGAAAGHFVAYNITPSNSNKDYNAREAAYAQAVTTDGGAPSARGGDLIAFDCKASGRNGFGTGGIAPTLRAMGHSNSHQNGGGHQAVAYDLRNGTGDDVAMSLQSGGMGDDRGLCPNAIPHVVNRWAVRRLTPTECERLQGFPDGYTNIPWRGKDFAPDGPRYKALGNSMAVNCMRWIGRRIELLQTEGEIAA